MKTILVVEDDEFFTMALSGLLESEGYSVVTAENGKQAIDRLEKHAIDCVVSDLQMPVMGGVELAKWVVQNRKVPFIMMTGYVESMNTLTAVELGAINMMYKPFSDEEMLKAVRDALTKAPDHEIPEHDKIEFAGFARVPQGALAPGAIAEYNLYRSIGGQLQKIVSKGEPFYLKDLVHQGSGYLFTEIGNLESIVRSNLMVIRAVSKSTSVNALKKNEMLLKSHELMIQRLTYGGGEQAILEECAELVRAFMCTLERSTIWEVLNRFQAASKAIYAPSLATAAIAVLIAQSRRESDETCVKLATAALFDGVEFAYASAVGEGAEIQRRLLVAGDFCTMIQPTSDQPGLRPAQALVTLEASGKYDRDSVFVLKSLMMADLSKGKHSA